MNTKNQWFVPKEQKQKRRKKKEERRNKNKKKHTQKTKNKTKQEKKPNQTKQNKTAGFETNFFNDPIIIESYLTSANNEWPSDGWIMEDG